MPVPEASAQKWQHVHPLTPVLKGGAGLVATIGVLVVIAFQSVQSLVEGLVRDALSGEENGESGFLEGVRELWPLLVREYPEYVFGGIGLLILVLALIGVSLWLSWKAMRYRIDESGVYLRSGVISKKERSASHDRVQSVDISLPFFPRLLGLSSLVFDVAGGGDSDVTISYLKRSQAEELREEILTHLRSLRTGPPGAQAGRGAGAGQEASTGAPEDGHYGAGHGGAPEWADGTPDGSATAEGGRDAGQDARAAAATDAPLGQRLVSQRRLDAVQMHAQDVADDLSESLAHLLAPYRLTPQSQAEGRLLRVPVHRLLLGSLLSMGALLSAVLVVGLLAAIVILYFAVGVQAAVSTLFGLIPAGLALFSAVRSQLAMASFTVSITQDGLRVSHGLTSTTNRIIPLDRIQAVKLTQPLLWRIPGWWRASFTIASEAKDDGSVESILLPVGLEDDVMLMLGLAMPDPRTAAGVDARELVLAGMYGTAADWSQPERARAEEQFRGRPRSSRWFDPLTWKRNAHAMTGTFTLIRSGRIVRGLDLVPHARVQSMRLHQGPLQRRAGVATINLHISAGPIHPQFGHLETAFAETLFEEHAHRTRQAREELDAELSGTGSRRSGSRPPEPPSRPQQQGDT